MDTATLSRLFDPFCTTRKDGRGSGLAVVPGVVRSHGGLVKVSGEQERATGFRVLLPDVLRPGTTAEPGSDPILPAASEPIRTPACERERRRVLVFDDDESIRRMFSMILRMLDYDVCAYPHCHDFCTHQECVNNDRPGYACADYIISDVFMNGRSGIDFAESLAQKQCPVRNIALMSGRWTEDARRRARAGGCAVFSKPLSAEEIALWLEGCSGRIPRNRVLVEPCEIPASRDDAQQPQ